MLIEVEERDIIIFSDIVPRGEHIRRLNAQAENDYAAIISGNSHYYRNIVIQRRRVFEKD